MAPMWGAQLEYGPGLRERKKQYVLGGVLGLGDGAEEDTAKSGAPDLDPGGCRGHGTPVPVINENISYPCDK